MKLLGALIDWFGSLNIISLLSRRLDMEPVLESQLEMFETEQLELSDLNRLIFCFFRELVSRFPFMTLRHSEYK